MEKLLRNKWVLYGGAAAAALGVVYLVYSSSSTTTATDASAAPAGDVMSYAAPAGFPVYSSGTGTQTADLGTNTDTSSATIDYLNALSQINAASAQAASQYNLASLDVQKQLGLANIDSVNRANDMAATSAEAQSLASLGSSVVDTVARAKLAGSSGIANLTGPNGNLAVSFDVANLSRNPKQNLSLVSATSGKSSTITLPSGQSLRGPNVRQSG